MRALDLSSGKELAARLGVARTVLSRAVGLLGRDALAAGEGLLIEPCKGVHTFFMKFPIDVVFLDRNGRVVGVVPNLKPQRMTKLLLTSVSVVELPAGTLAATETVVGNEVLIE